MDAFCLQFFLGQQLLAVIEECDNGFTLQCYWGGPQSETRQEHSVPYRMHARLYSVPLGKFVIDCHMETLTGF